MWIPLKREINLKSQAAVIERGFWHVSLIPSEMVGEDCITQFFPSRSQHNRLLA
jgi:hypothetical protein